MERSALRCVQKMGFFLFCSLNIVSGPSPAQSITSKDPTKVVEMQMNEPDKVVEGKGNIASKSPRDSARGLASLGEFYCGLGKLDEGLDYCNEAVKIAPKDAAIYRFRAHVYIARKNLIAAINDLKMAVSLEPDNPEILCELGVRLAQMDRNDEALSCFNKSVEIKPTARNLAARGTFYCHTGKIDLAKVDLDRALAKSPNYSDVVSLKMLIEQESRAKK